MMSDPSNHIVPFTLPFIATVSFVNGKQEGFTTILTCKDKKFIHYSQDTKQNFIVTQSAENVTYKTFSVTPSVPSGPSFEYDLKGYFISAGLTNERNLVTRGVTVSGKTDA